MNLFRIYDLTSRSFRRYLSHVQRREHLSNSRKMLHIIEFAKEALEKVEIAGGRGGQKLGQAIMSLTQGYNLFVRMLKLQEGTDM